ncbi:unnamed protein product [Cunninghamella blakesleeana]
MDKPMKWWYHNEIQGTHLLFESFMMDNSFKLILGYIFIVLICWSERALTYYHGRLEYSHKKKARWSKVFLRTILYGILTVLRLWYMLITMYFNTGLFIMVIIALTSAQFVIEVLNSSKKSKYSEYVNPQYNNGNVNRIVEEEEDIDEEEQKLVPKK